MVAHWASDCILDNDDVATGVWLSKSKDSSDTPWVALRKMDIKALNKAYHEWSYQVYIDGGRCTANLRDLTITNNIYDLEKPPRPLCRATWFLLDERYTDKNVKGEKFILPQPLEEEDAKLVEHEYQRVHKKGVDYASKNINLDDAFIKSVDLKLSKEEGKFKVCLTATGDGATRFVQKPANFSLGNMFAGEVKLQRGYQRNEEEEEDYEAQLGEAGHLIFVVHGIGETYFNKEDSKIPSMVEEVDKMRKNIHSTQVKVWKDICKDYEKKQRVPLPPPPMKIELIPIVWYDEIHGQDNDLMTSLNAVTLKTIPALRSIANDVTFDILMYMTPEFCEQTLSFVTSLINSAHKKFKTIHQNFETNGGKVSLIGHSLGSVISWDLLSVLRATKENGKIANKNSSVNRRNSGSFFSFEALCGSITQAPSPLPSPVKGVNDNDLKNNIVPSPVLDDPTFCRMGRWGPTLTKESIEHIGFEPEFTIFLGSPVGLFLTLRGAHGTFNAMRGVTGIDEHNNLVSNGDKMVSSFAHPTGALYNIFHPSDPVAYRIEPLLLPPKIPEKDLPPCEVLTTENSGVQLHIKAQQGFDSFFKKLNRKSTRSLIQKTTDDHDGDPSSSKTQSATEAFQYSTETKFPLGGSSPRVDFQMQSSLIDNQYLSAVTAHSGYWQNTMIIDFIAEKASRVEPFP